jgi:magnesium-transporting ATPase (P-type)
MHPSAASDAEKGSIHEKGAQFEEIHHEEHNDDISAELESLLHTNPSTGLTSQEVAERTAKFGRNELPERKKNPILKLLSFFTGAIAYLIEIACIIAAIGKNLYFVFI